MTWEQITSVHIQRQFNSDLRHLHKRCMSEPGNRNPAVIGLASGGRDKVQVQNTDTIELR